MSDRQLAKHEFIDILMEMADGLLLLSNDGTCVDIITSSTVFFMQPIDEIIGKKIDEFLPNDVVEKFENGIVSLLNLKENQTF